MWDNANPNFLQYMHYFSYRMVQNTNALVHREDEVKPKSQLATPLSIYPQVALSLSFPPRDAALAFARSANQSCKSCKLSCSADTLQHVDSALTLITISKVKTPVKT